MYSTRTTTQTVTQAKRLASRIGAELLQMRALYGSPSEEHVDKFTREAELYLAAGLLDSVRYGFERNGQVIFELYYSAGDASSVDDKPGRVPPGHNVSGATFFSYLKQNETWWRLTPSQRDAFRQTLPLERTAANEPVLAPGVRTQGTKYFSEETLGLRREVRGL